jgi:glutathione synthase
MECKVLFVVQDQERNAFDQRAIEWELMKQYVAGSGRDSVLLSYLRRKAVRVVRQTFTQLASSARIAEDDRRTLLVQEEGSAEPTRISVVYFRAGYGPGDYPSSKEWETRLLLERSGAIKCPSVPLQLAGAKKVQQVLSEPAVLKGLIQKHRPLQDFSHGTWLELEDTFIGLYPLDDSPLGQQGYELARSHPERFVLKPQREGGGNNVYRGDIPPFLDELEKKDKEGTLQGLKHREGYILMDLIRPPEGSRNYLVRAGDSEPRLGEVVSELGIYGTILYTDKGGQCDISSNAPAGHLLRTKGKESDEGGVAVGFSVIDSPLLVGESSEG